MEISGSIYLDSMTMRDGDLAIARILDRWAPGILAEMTTLDPDHEDYREVADLVIYDAEAKAYDTAHIVAGASDGYYCWERAR